MERLLPRFLIFPGLCLALGLTLGYVIGTWRGVRLAERRAAFVWFQKRRRVHFTDDG